MNYLEQLKSSAARFNSIVCLGLDPVIEDIPLKGEPGDVIPAFYEGILNRMVQSRIYAGAVKPNYAFYAQYGLPGILALKKVIDLYKSQGFPVILDVKRGDIGKTAQAYAKEAFDFFNADAVTLSPLLGYDSISPFIKAYPDKGYYILTRTSNSSASEIQDQLMVTGEPLYEYIARKIIDWYHPGIASVAGATYPEQLERISNIFSESGKDIPFLIPGVGTQGGSVSEVMAVLNQTRDVRLHRINSSSGINYAYKKHTSLSYDLAAMEELKALNEEIGSI